VIGQIQTGVGRVFSLAIAASMVLVIAVASLTSRQMFGEIYHLVAAFLRLSDTYLSMALRDSPSLGHFLCYALLSLSLAGAFSPRYKLLAPLAAITFGVLMEMAQITIPSRDASFLDIGVNVLGVALGFGIYQIWVTYMREALRQRFS